MTIWALKGPSTADYNQEEYNKYNKTLEFLSNSIKQGTSRFGWSYFQTADLEQLQNKPWHEMSQDEQSSWAKAGFLLDIEPGDWVVHINVPYWGACLAGEVSKSYSFEQTDTMFPILDTQ